MLEKALTGSKRYWTWMFFLLAVAGAGFISYLYQFKVGLGVTGLSRDVSWGLYIGQFTFLVGVAASGVMLVLPYYLHDYKKFGKITILGEFLAVASVTMCMLFIFVDMGQPMRILNVMLHPSPNSVLFWDSVVLGVYLMLNIVIGWVVLSADRKTVPPPKWIKPLIIVSIIWAPSIHTVTAFLYQGNAGRDFWFDSLLAPSFLASAFASGPAFIIILSLLIRKFTKFDPGKEAIQTLAKIVTYAILVSLFFLLVKLFTVFYSGSPKSTYNFQYLFMGIGESQKMIPLMWTSVILAVAGAVLLVIPATRRNESTLAVACVFVFISLLIDKGFGLLVGGFVPNTFGKVFEYWPTLPETLITLGVWAIGLLMLTALFKIAVSVREETAGIEIEH